MVAVLVANFPQLALSGIYVVYNNMLTRLQVARAWALKSSRHSYLRVTNPRGLQRSTYRLQLPYRYTVPLIIASAFFHWLTSNAIYIFISQGDYFEDIVDSTSHSDPNLPTGSAVSVGYSIIAMAILAIGLLCGLSLPIIWSRRRLLVSRNSVGCNSLAISASCHVSTLAKPDSASSVSQNRVTRQGSETPGVGESELDLLSPEQDHSILDREEVRLKMIAQSRLRWGAVEMPQEWSNSLYNRFRKQIGHISFGTTNDKVEDPVHNQWYA